MSLGTRKPRHVTGRNINDATITLSRSPTEHDVAKLQASLDAFTAEHGFTSGVISSGPTSLIVNIPDQLDGGRRQPFEEWFNAECDRIENQP